MNVCIALIHLISLAFLFGWGLRGRNFSRIERFILTYILIWADFVWVGHVMSLFSMLGNQTLFLVLSISSAAAVIPLLRKVAPFPTVVPIGDDGSEVTPRGLFGGGSKCPQCGAYGGDRMWKAQRALMVFFLGTALLALICNVTIAFTVLPNNPDSLAYRFPRVFFYLSQGSFFHFANSIDPRLLFYPLNGVLLYSFMVYHGLSPWAFTLLSCLSWVVVGLAVYSACRNFKVSQLGSVATAWIICLTPNVLAQATSTNDEIVAAAPLLVAVLFACKWLQSRRTSHLILAAVAAGLSFGAKLHFYFYWPLFVLIGLGFGAVLIFRRDSCRGMVKPLLLPLAIACAIAGMISLPFAAYNVASKGEIMLKRMSDEFSNKPFRPDVAVQNVTLYGSQMLISPILDLQIASTEKRRTRIDNLRTYTNERFFSWVNLDPQHMAWSYRFRGIWSPISYYLSEDTVFLGFTPWLFAFGLLYVFRSKSESRLLMAGLMASFWIQIITYAMSTKYIETTGIYFTYSLIVASPGLAVLWLPGKSRWMSRIKTGILAVVIVTHVILAINMFKYNAMRKPSSSFRAQQNKDGATRVDKRIRTEMRTAEKLRLVYTHWELSFYNLLRIARRSDVSTENVPVSDGGKTLNIFSFEATPALGRIPIKLYDNPGDGLTYLGNYHSCMGLEYAFATGSGVALRYPEDSGYIVLNATVEKTPTSFKVVILPAVEGVRSGDVPRFRYALASAGTVLSQTEWMPDPKAELSANISEPNDLVLEVEVDLAGQGKTARVSFPLTSAKPVLEGKP